MKAVFSSRFSINSLPYAASRTLVKSVKSSHGLSTEGSMQVSIQSTLSEKAMIVTFTSYDSHGDGSG